MTRIIGLIGKIASGKTIVADYLVNKKGGSYYRFSDVLRDILIRIHKPITRENLQDLGLAIRKVFGDGILAQAVRKDISSDKAELIVVDGIRYLDEFDMVKSLGGTIIFITAPETARYERVIMRATRGEAKISLDEFKKSEEKETELLVDKLGAKADHIVENTGTIEELKNAIDAILDIT
jgi:dephospho-CoA kinase